MTVAHKIELTPQEVREAVAEYMKAHGYIAQRVEFLVNSDADDILGAIVTTPTQATK